MPEHVNVLSEVDADAKLLMSIFVWEPRLGLLMLLILRGVSLVLMCWLARFQSSVRRNYGD